MSNKILELRKDFESDDYSSNYNPFKLPPGQKVSLDELIKLKDDLIKVRDFWEKQNVGLIKNETNLVLSFPLFSD